MFRKNILFDFDGTLFDTGPGIINCMRHALETCGYSAGDDRAMHRFIGPPVLDALRDFYGMDEKEAQRVKEVYRAAYRAEGVYECAPMAGAEECLRALRSAGVHIAVATSKPLFFAEQILRRFSFEQYFEAVCGARSDAHSGKAEIVRQAMECLGASPAETAMVGDRKYDVLGAAACGIPCIGFDSGFAEEGEFERAGAYCIVRNFAELQVLLLA